MGLSPSDPQACSASESTGCPEPCHAWKLIALADAGHLDFDWGKGGTSTLGVRGSVSLTLLLVTCLSPQNSVAVLATLLEK